VNNKDCNRRSIGPKKHVYHLKKNCRSEQSNEATNKRDALYTRTKIISSKSARQTGGKNYKHISYTNEMKPEELKHAETISKMIGAGNAPEDKHAHV